MNYKYWTIIGKDKSIEETITTCKYIEIKDVVQLKHKHQYYAQVQLGIALLNLHSCDFVVYASQNNSFKIINVPFDYKFTFNMLKKIKENFFNNMLHVICDNNID